MARRWTAATVEDMNRALGTKAISAQEAIAKLAGSVQDPLELLEEARVRISRVVPNVGGAWMLTDPESLLPVSLIKDMPAPPSMGQRFFEHELFVPDFAPFADLHRDGVVVTTLDRATNGRPELSPRYRDIHAPAGLGPELRILFRTGSATWGMTCVSREAGDPDFSDEELAWIRGRRTAHRSWRARGTRPAARDGRGWPGRRGCSS